MAETTYKKITDVEQVEALNDGATVLVNDNGALKQVAASVIGERKITITKQGSQLRTGVSFAEAGEMLTQNGGSAKTEIILGISQMDSSAMILSIETYYAISSRCAMSMTTSEIVWIQFNFQLPDGTVTYQFNPDGSITEVTQ